MSNRKELESTVCDIEKKLAEHGAILRQKEVSLRHAQEDLEEKRGDLTYHTNNLKFMDQRATLVDIKEYRGVLKLQAHAREEVEDVALKVRGLASACASYRREIAAGLQEIAKAKKVLADYGDVITPAVPHWRKS